MSKKKREPEAAKPLQCPKCKFAGSLDDFEVLGADDGKLICPECSFMGGMDGGKKKKPPDLYLLVRTHPTGFESIYLIRRDGAAHAGLMHGEVIAGVADLIAEVTGLRVEREEGKLDCRPLGVPGCVTTDEQKTLFS